MLEVIAMPWVKSRCLDQKSTARSPAVRRRTTRTRTSTRAGRVGTASDRKLRTAAL
jgi:hypothetical protein